MPSIQNMNNMTIKKILSKLSVGNRLRLQATSKQMRNTVQRVKPFAGPVNAHLKHYEIPDPPQSHIKLAIKYIRCLKSIVNQSRKMLKEFVKTNKILRNCPLNLNCPYHYYDIDRHLTADFPIEQVKKQLDKGGIPKRYIDIDINHFAGFLTMDIIIKPHNTFPHYLWMKVGLELHQPAAQNLQISLSLNDNIYIYEWDEARSWNLMFNSNQNVHNMVPTISTYFPPGIPPLTKARLVELAVDLKLVRAFFVSEGYNAKNFIVDLHMDPVLKTPVKAFLKRAGIQAK